MAYATKTRGFRHITVAGVRCRWRVRMGEYSTVITVQDACAKGSQRALVTLPGYTDPWLMMPSRATKFIVITPALVRRVVEQAFALGWQPALHAGPLNFDFYPEADHAA